MKQTILLLSFLLFQLACRQNNIPAGTNNEQQQIKASPIEVDGLSFVAPPRAFTTDPMAEVKSVGANWIAVIPYAYTRQGETEVRFNSPRQWWGERTEGVIETIQRANKANVKVMLKPQVYFPGSWPGGHDFDNEKDWETWEREYRKYIMTFVPIADSLNVPLFCIGTEFKMSEQKRSPFWRQLIKDIRAQYKGKLTYASNWDCYDKVTFWDDLDYIGIDAYFPLVDKKQPSIKSIIAAWGKYTDGIHSIHKKTKKPVLFTEFGYLSVDGATHNTWDLEAKVRQLPVNEQVQANALHALFTVFSKKEYWAGGFLWKWFPNMKGHEGYPASDYTPQGKVGEQVLKEWYEADE
ncbi:MAG: hypothetical protein AB8F74_17860 [Saprospiraceae bacterium]